ncbi:MAG: PQQ-binding-like beta-propeller repeat protein, partial [Myxococcales bacterium]|nr:PQQ-binding-like beta-propeller repeat protein [Myxococcales bacterium]
MRRALISLALLATAHCGPAPGYEVEAPAPAPGSASPVEAVVAPAEETRPGVVIEPAETGCARASRLHAKARALHTAGFVNRPRALVAAAAKLCPEAKLPPLHDSSPPSGDQASLQARLRAATGELPQPLAQGWLRSVEASGGAPRWLAPPTGQVIGISAGFVAVAVGEHGWGRGRGEVALLDFATGAPRYLFDTKQPVAQALVAGDRLLTRHDREVQLWSLADGKPGAKLRWSGERYRAAAFMNGGTQVLVVGESSGRGVLRVFDAASGDSGLDYQDPALGELTQAALVDDHRVVVASFAGAFLVNLKTKQHQPLVGSPSDKSSRDDVTALAVGAGRIATADWQGVVRVFGIDSLREEKRFSATRVSALAFHGADRLVVAGEAGFRGDVRTFDLGTGAAVRARELGGGALALTPDGGAVLVGGHQGPRLEDLEGKARW